MEEGRRRVAEELAGGHPSPIRGQAGARVGCRIGTLTDAVEWTQQVRRLQSSLSDTKTKRLADAERRR